MGLLNIHLKCCFSVCGDSLLVSFFFPSFLPLPPFPASSFPFILSCSLCHFSFFDFVRSAALLGLFLYWNSFRGCLRGIPEASCVLPTPTFGEEPASGWAPGIRKPWLALGGKHYSWHTAAPLCVWGGDCRYWATIHPLPGTFTGLPLRPLAMGTPPPPMCPAPGVLGFAALSLGTPGYVTV